MKVAILGYGLLGRLCALALADAFADRTQLHIFTQESQCEKESTGWKAAAMLAPIAESTHAPQALVRMGWASMLLWPQLLSKLSHSFGSIPTEEKRKCVPDAGCEPSPYFQQQGSLVLAHRADLKWYRQFQNQIKPEEKAKVSPLGRAALADLEPELAAHFSQGLLLENEGHIDNHGFYTAVDEYLQSRCTFHWQAMVSGDVKQYVKHQSHQHGLGDVDWIIDCRGLGANAQWPELRGVRGEVMRVHAPDVSLSRPVRLMHPRYPLYVVPKPNQEFVLGATEIESEDESAISVRSSLTILSAAYSLHPGFAEARVLNAHVGLRPTLLDHCPQVRVDEQLISVNGLYRHGYLVGPALSEIVARIIQRKPLGELQPFESTFVSRESA